MRWLVAVGVVLIIGIVGAAVYARQLVRERDVELITIATVWPGASPEAVERSVSIPIESAASRTRGLIEVLSESREGVSLVTLVVRGEGRDGFLISHEVNELLAQTLRELPSDVNPPSVSRVLPPARAQHRRFVVRSSERSPTEVSRWVEWEFRRKLEVQAGVRAVELCGVVQDTIEVRPDLQHLQAFGIKPLQFADALEAANREVPGGSQFLIRAGGRLTNVDDLANVSITPEVRVRDVATVERRGVPDRCVAFQNGVRVVSVDVVSEGPLPKPLEQPTPPPSISVTEFKSGRAETWAVEDERALARLDVPGLVLKRDVVELLVDPAATEGDFEKLRQTPGFALISREGDTLVRISGDDLEALAKQAEVVRKKLSEAFPKHTVGARPRNAQPELQLIPRERSTEVARLLSFAMAGRQVATLNEGEQQLDVMLKLDLRDETQILDRLRELQLSDGRPLSSIVEIQSREAPAAITRVNSRRTVQLSTSAPAGDVRKALADVQLPLGMALSVPDVP